MRSAIKVVDEDLWCYQNGKEERQIKKMKKYWWGFTFATPSGKKTPINPSLPYRQSRICFTCFRVSDELVHILVNRSCEMHSAFHPSSRFTHILNSFMGFFSPFHALFSSYTCALS